MYKRLEKLVVLSISILRKHLQVYQSIYFKQKFLKVKLVTFFLARRIRPSTCIAISYTLHNFLLLCWVNLLADFFIIVSCLTRWHYQILTTHKQMLRMLHGSDIVRVNWFAFHEENRRGNNLVATIVP